MTSSAEQIRNWSGPAILGYGFRPFFLSAAAYAAFAMVVWIGVLMGLWQLPSALGPVEWHIHEFLWGYLSAVAAGFMLTAVPNWTGRLPIVGLPLLLLWSSWLLGRIVVFLSAAIPPAVVAAAELSFLSLLIFVLAREIVAGRNWRNLKVLALAALLLAGDAVFLMENLTMTGMTHQSYGVRMGIGSAIMLIILIGGRIIPSFTRNWLARQPAGRLPVAFNAFDKIIVAFSAAALLAWLLLPEAQFSGLLLGAAGVLNLLRLWRWAGWRSFREPLVAILHVAYLFVPLGFLLVALHVLWPVLIPHSGALHAWTSGAILLMTLAVMTRASLGHSGMPLHADGRILAIYLLAIAVPFARISAAFLPGMKGLLEISGLAWILCFLMFVAVYAPLFLRPRARSSA